MSLISIERLQKHLRVIAKNRDPYENPEDLKAIETYICQALESFGYEVKPDPFSFEGRDFQNWIAARPGAQEAPEWIVGAHFDAVPGSPGADDNASGVAALLEIARTASESGILRNIHFIAFHMEEYGMAGSRAYAAKRKESLRKAARAGHFKGMLSLEMIGYTDRQKGSQKMPAVLKPFYPDTGDFLALVGDNHSEKLLRAAKKAFSQPDFQVETLSVPLSGNLFPDVRLSDHSAFWDEGLPALLVTDTSFFRNPHYHLASDTVETLDLSFLRRTAEGALNLILTH